MSIYGAGRVDDVINVSGHRIGTAEVEGALVTHAACAEAAVVPIDHPVKGQALYAFVTLSQVAPEKKVLDSGSWANGLTWGWLVEVAHFCLGAACQLRHGLWEE
jgi:acyl-CoA synthetase (AMP-forming)/AMP-acid ligase II